VKVKGDYVIWQEGTNNKGEAASHVSKISLI
jgi:hypothetical protein